MIRYCHLESPLGPLLVSRDEIGITTLWLPSGRHPTSALPSWSREDAAFNDVADQLTEYFAGARTTFDLPLHPTGSAFQLRVWAALHDIPYGETTSYGVQASRIGVPNGARAVGLANGQNPISIIVPCHRVVGANGSLTGYGGGLDAKRWLLSLEASNAGLFAQ